MCVILYWIQIVRNVLYYQNIKSVFAMTIDGRVMFLNNPPSVCKCRSAPVQFGKISARLHFFYLIKHLYLSDLHCTND